MSADLNESSLEHPHLPFNFAVDVLDGAFLGPALGLASFYAAPKLGGWQMQPVLT